MQSVIQLFNLCYQYYVYFSSIIIYTSKLLIIFIHININTIFKNKFTNRYYSSVVVIRSPKNKL